MDDHSTTFGDLAAQAMTAAAASLEPATKPSTTSDENAHRRHFVQTFRRWAVLFKRKDGDVQSDKWLIAEYYKSLGHLSEAGLNRLTDALKETCIFFPTIKECLDATRCGPYDWGHPFFSLRDRGPNPLLRSAVPPPVRLAAPVERIEYDG